MRARNEFICVSAYRERETESTVPLLQLKADDISDAPAPPFATQNRTKCIRFCKIEMNN